MKYFLLTILLLIFLPGLAYALDLNPNPILPNSSLTIVTNVRYDISMELVSGAIVNYIILPGKEVDCKLQHYPEAQTLEEIGKGLYSKTTISPPNEGTYTLCLRARKDGFREDSKGINLFVTKSEIEVALINFLKSFFKFTGFFAKSILHF